MFIVQRYETKRILMRIDMQGKQAYRSIWRAKDIIVMFRWKTMIYQDLGNSRH